MNKGRVVNICKFNSPCGVLLLGDFEGHLCMCDWFAEKRQEIILNRIIKGLNARNEDAVTPFLEQAMSQVQRYFLLQQNSIDLPLLMVGTNFQRQVWRQLQFVGYGTTVSYSELANRIGNPRAVRAVASACRANAMSIIVPCHRVVAKNGDMAGYAGGVDAKRYLLNLEIRGALTTTKD